MGLDLDPSRLGLFGLRQVEGQHPVIQGEGVLSAGDLARGGIRQVHAHAGGRLRSVSTNDDALDRAYFSAMRQLMERTDETTYVSGFQIWQYQIEWQERRVERIGYLFFGARNDRLLFPTLI